MLSLAIFDVLRELGESTIESFFVWIVVSPFLSCFISVLDLIVLRLISFSLKMESLVVRGEGSLRIATADKRFHNFSLMFEFLIPLHIKLIIKRSAFIFITSKEMASCSATKTSFHIIYCNIFLTRFNISLLISSIINFIFKFFHMLEL